jgi:hypothetical protein
MLFNIMDVNRDGEIVARIESNNGKNALKQFQRRCCFSTGLYEIKKSRFNWCMLSSFGAAYYAAPQRRGRA